MIPKQSPLRNYYSEAVKLTEGRTKHGFDQVTRNQTVNRKIETATNDIQINCELEGSYGMLT